MLCPKCLVEREIQDFQNKEICFKCVYEEKTKGKLKKQRFCKICGSLLPSNRPAYCSFKCAEKADKLHWTRSIRILAL